jgi:aspartate carbamoyltransferase catalytic subunit
VLTDLYTTWKELGRLDGLRFLLVGDMRMRTMHSILYAFSQFDVESYVVSPPEMSLLPEFKAELDERNVRYQEAESVEKVLGECDVIYMEPVVQADYTMGRTAGGVPTARRVPGDELLRTGQPILIILLAPAWTSCRSTWTRRGTRATGSRRSTAS